MIKNLFFKYKWWVLGYVLYMIVLGGIIYNANDWGRSHHGTEIAYQLIIAYIGVPIALYVLYYIWQYKILKKPHKHEETRKQVIEIVDPPQEERASWPLMEFAKAHGRMKVHYTNEQLDMCYFINEKEEVTKAYVAKAIKHYQVEDIEREKDNLSIITLESGAYCLCREWPVVNLQEDRI